MAVETNRIGSNVGIMNHYKYYSSYVTGGIISKMTNELAYAIYLKCGKSYTSTAAKYCPTQSYINDNFWVNYEDNRSTINVKVTINGNYTDDNLVKLSDLTYTVIEERDYAENISAVSQDVTYYIGYSNFYRNKPNDKGVEVTTSFGARAQFFQYSYSVSGAGVSTLSAVVNPRDPQTLTIKTKKSTVGYVNSNIHVWDTINPDAEDTTIVRYYVRPVSQLSFVTNSPTYIVNGSGTANNLTISAYGSIISGVHTNINSTPIPQRYYCVMVTYGPEHSQPDNSGNYSSTEFISVEDIFTSGLVTNTTYGSSSKKSFIKTTISPVFIDNCYTTLYNKINAPNIPNYTKIVAYAENYNGTTMYAVHNAYFINDVTSCTFVDTLSPITILYDENNYIDVDCCGTNNEAQIFLKSFSMTCSNSNITTSANSVSMKSDATRISYTWIPQIIGNATLTFTGVKYNNSNITATKSISSVYSNYNWFYLIQNGWVYTVLDNSAAYDISMFTSADLPEHLHIAENTDDQPFYLKIIYEDMDGAGEKSAYIRTRYTRVDAHKFRLVYEPESITFNQSSDQTMEFSFGDDIRIARIELYNSILDDLIAEVNIGDRIDNASILIQGYNGNEFSTIYWIMSIEMRAEQSIDMPFKDRNIDWFDSLILFVTMEPYI